jgi:beta-galactosidase
MPVVFSIEGDHFVRNGVRHRIFSGALHYFRVPPEYWEDRLLKYRACGLNTVETYMPWNLHEPRSGQFDFSEMLDVRRFVQLAGALGLDVIVRPGPYICAEWEGGGMPAWLLADPGMRLRSTYAPFMEATGRYFRRVMQEIGDLQAPAGGPIIAMQVENEYGSYGSDLSYLAALETVMKDAGCNVLLFSSDGAEGYTLEQGTLPHLFKTANFGSRAGEAFRQLREVQPCGPMMCMEFWVGWFDHWGGGHHVRSAESVAEALEEMLSLGASFNIYMMHGGSNFGFMNGANCAKEYRPTVSSYDYDAPLDERGDPTPKYLAIREVLQRHGAKVEELPQSLPATAYGALALSEACDLFAALPVLGKPVCSSHPLTMEEVGQNVGFILYRTHLRTPHSAFSLCLAEVADHATIFHNKEYRGQISRDQSEDQFSEIEMRAQESVLDILVENLGRVNHGRRIHDRKGLPQGARRGAQLLYDWEIYPFEWIELPAAIPWQAAAASILTLPVQPRFHRGMLNVKECRDSYIKVVSGTTGVIWINGKCLGRFRAEGPHQTLFLPAPWLRVGRNEIAVFDQANSQALSVELLAEPELGPIIQT